MKNNIIFVTGFFGAPVMQSAVQLAKKHDCPLMILDDEIEKADGRSVRRICMMMGEHEYRNKEYEAIKEILSRVEDAHTNNPISQDACCDNEDEHTNNHIKYDVCCDGKEKRTGCADENCEHSNIQSVRCVDKTGNESDTELVVCCGDGVLLDDMSRELILQHELVIISGDMTCDELWENAKLTDNSCHAFMHFGSDEEKRAAFAKLYERQRELFMPYV